MKATFLVTLLIASFSTAPAVSFAQTDRISRQPGRSNIAGLGSATRADGTLDLAMLWSQDRAAGKGPVRFTHSPMQPEDIERIVPYGMMVGQNILSKLAQLPITQWNHKAEDATVQHLGPVAQDFHALFGLGQDDRHIAALDGNGVALAAIQGLYQMLVEKVAAIATLQADRDGQARQLAAQQEQIRALQEQNATLEARLATIEQLVAGR
jgi:hypothetical protein